MDPKRSRHFFPVRPRGIFSRTPAHPGRFLESRYLKPLRISQQSLARALGISRRRVNELIRGCRSITPDTAIRLAVYFGTDATFWMELQIAWDMHQAWRAYRSATLTPPPVSLLRADCVAEQDG